ncbi:P-type DNA transfer ATPase VirB11 [Salmonella enterica subsp. enterica serovar Benue]|uniref:P-type DNA transfer ATPase VirB11 n=1 Tax=Salmonella enterica TaxID=28901 RepID=UPI000FB4D999|nr:P-type DNA transfer ATPase VirB11 [Salmonella enterica]EDR3562096.1 P-type DNA transfer ATPase VirB11 [Salmonella enterica subsp. enterica serovar Benue]MIW33719.1 P-type DNA transfer ATPase VirB11 [Salmonella enterica subsp. enterica serovar Derby]MBH0601264.1 P-type DNA transfer ATPase VirB11 [Salmonella enterica]MBH0654960.1 P-type DNA transfer ATPase VirB11 [Salmonella enterica]MBH0667750.1 P-type DNA transfer ATPase VirB11 [Salmonella enterica]
MEEHNRSAACRDQLYRAGIAEALVRPGVSDVAINQPGGLWIEDRDGWHFEENPRLNYQLCIELAKSIAFHCNRDINSQEPIKSVTLPDGQRGQLVLPPCAEDRTVAMSFRAPSTQRFTLDDYEDSGRFSDLLDAAPTWTLLDWQQELKKRLKYGQIKAFFELAVEKKLNISLAGGTGSGKTTLSKSIIDVFPKNRRLITIEEVHELDLPYHPNHVHLLYGDVVRPKEVIASCMRMKPDHIFLAELTGDEAWSYLEALNTGHAGSVTTLHANNAHECVARYCSLIKQSDIGQRLDYDFIERKIRTSVDVIAYCEKSYVKSIRYEPEEKMELLR